MAIDDDSLIAEVRLLTNLPVTIISVEDFQDLVALTKRELLADIGLSDIDWYGEIQAERALFWLTCIHAKVHIGEIDAPNFSIGELKVRQSSFTERQGIWFDNFWKHYRAMTGGTPMGHITANRSNRTYEFDN